MFKTKPILPSFTREDASGFGSLPLRLTSAAHVVAPIVQNEPNATQLHAPRRFETMFVSGKPLATADTWVLVGHTRSPMKTQMLSLKIAFALVTVAAFVATTRAQLPPDVKSDIGPDVPDRIRVRPGYRVTRAVAANKLPGGQDSEARFLQFSADGKTLYVSARHHGEIYALRDPDANGVYQTVT